MTRSRKPKLRLELECRTLQMPLLFSRSRLRRLPCLCPFPSAPPSPLLMRLPRPIWSLLQPPAFFRSRSVSNFSLRAADPSFRLIASLQAMRVSVAVSTPASGPDFAPS